MSDVGCLICEFKSYILHHKSYISFMAFLQTGFPGLVVFEPNVFGDERGYFFESYNQQSFEKEGLYYNCTMA